LISVGLYYTADIPRIQHSRHFLVSRASSGRREADPSSMSRRTGCLAPRNNHLDDQSANRTSSGIVSKPHVAVTWIIGRRPWCAYRGWNG